MITYSKFEGDRESKACDVFLNGEVVGLIEIINEEVFQGPATMRRTIRFAEVNVALTGQHSREDREASFHTVDGYTKASGLKAAKAILNTWLRP